ncbi:hypothetical protein MAR_023445 [Mya arenaria]|uniref:Uncharacterized protein n=1 Tax=Mya arenaria TaxID=6604 RepID=A0ABY7DMZ9_MYAAR|nr:hypothetical protein MAR_023445 [Mya arenaria]
MSCLSWCCLWLCFCLHNMLGLLCKQGHDLLFLNSCLLITMSCLWWVLFMIVFLFSYFAVLVVLPFNYGLNI